MSLAELYWQKRNAKAQEIIEEQTPNDDMARSLSLFRKSENETVVNSNKKLPGESAIDWERRIRAEEKASQPISSEKDAMMEIKRREQAMEEQRIAMQGMHEHKPERSGGSIWS